ncbi:hypothetical protein [Telmatospirillum siberiense]|uniref:hypothetical protein n=1 Tax=Telmatospirillum siberiense TaxID=382514 RepID=UPI0011AF307E|nr:hypothetical protein [Telmatospirillum siberiense]
MNHQGTKTPRRLLDQSAAANLRRRHSADSRWQDGKMPVGHSATLVPWWFKIFGGAFLAIGEPEATGKVLRGCGKSLRDIISVVIPAKAGIHIVVRALSGQQILIPIEHGFPLSRE